MSQEFVRDLLGSKYLKGGQRPLTDPSRLLIDTVGNKKRSRVLVLIRRPRGKISPKNYSLRGE